MLLCTSGLLARLSLDVVVVVVTVVCVSMVAVLVHVLAGLWSFIRPLLVCLMAEVAAAFGRSGGDDLVLVEKDIMLEDHSQNKTIQSEEVSITFTIKRDQNHTVCSKCTYMLSSVSEPEKGPHLPKRIY